VRVNVVNVLIIGPWPPVSDINVVEDPDAQTELFSHSGNKPEMGISRVSSPEKDTGGER